MPIYEYQCEKGHTFEVMQRMSDDPVTPARCAGAGRARVPPDRGPLQGLGLLQHRLRHPQALTRDEGRRRGQGQVRQGRRFLELVLGQLVLGQSSSDAAPSARRQSASDRRRPTASRSRGLRLAAGGGPAARALTPLTSVLTALCTSAGETVSADSPSGRVTAPVGFSTGDRRRAADLRRPRTGSAA